MPTIILHARRGVPGYPEEVSDLVGFPRADARAGQLLASLGLMAHERVYDPADPILARVREIALALPEAVEVEAWGRPTFRAGKKIFVTYHAGQDHPSAIIIKPDPAEAEALRQDGRFFVPPYWTKWLALDVDRGDTDWGEVAELLEASYRQVALKRMIAALDG